MTFKRLRIAFFFFALWTAATCGASESIQPERVQTVHDAMLQFVQTREALSSFAVEMGLKVAQCLLDDEVAQRCGQRHERVPNRTETCFGHQLGFVTIAGQKVPIANPRVRSTDGRGEAELLAALDQIHDSQTLDNQRKLA